MVLSVVIVDDEQLAREELSYLLKSIDDVTVVAQGHNGIEAVNLVKEFSPDLLFLDVQMPGLDGFGALKKLIDKKVGLPQIVFATAFDQYAVKAFEVNAIDYILKPFDKKRISAAVEKARKKIQGVPADQQRLDTLVKLLESQRPQNSKVLLRSAGRLLLVDQKDLCFASIEDGIISVVATNLEGQSNCRTLEELLEGLDPETFWRAHRSFVVNINRIKEVVPWFKSSYQLRMDDRKQTEIPVSRAQTKRLSANCSASSFLQRNCPQASGNRPVKNCFGHCDQLKSRLRYYRDFQSARAAQHNQPRCHSNSVFTQQPMQHVYALHGLACQRRNHISFL